MSLVMALDDDPHRMIALRQGFTGSRFVAFDRSSAAITWLTDHTPKLLLLDHDLDQHGTDRILSGCGADVAHHLARNPARFIHSLIVIHSLNEDGAAYMQRLLTKAGLAATCMPWLWKNPKDMERLQRETS